MDRKGGAGKDKMDALGQADRGSGGGIVEVADGIDPRSRGIYETSRAQFRRRAGETIDEAGSGEAASGLDEPADLDVVGHGGAMDGGIEDVLEREPRIVAPRIVVDRASAQAVPCQRGLQFADPGGI